MAQAVAFRRYIPENTKDDIAAKVEQAPAEHGEAILSAYQLLQQLHDTGTLDLLRGMLGAGDAVVNHVVDVISTPQMVNALRNLLALGTVLGNLDPELLHTAIKGQPEDRDRKAPSLFAILRQMRTEEARLGLGVAVGLLSAFGSAVKQERAAAE
jgi:uncharacterized protein YjgD (DUF1641 family)